MPQEALATKFIINFLSETKQSTFPSDLEDLLYKTTNFKKSLDVKSYCLNFILGALLTLPYTKLPEKTIIEHSFLKYEKIGKIKYFVSGTIDGKKQVIYRMIDVSGDEAGKNKRSLDHNEAQEILKLFESKGKSVQNFKVKNAYQYSITAKELYKTYPADAQDKQFKFVQIKNFEEKDLQSFFKTSKNQKPDQTVNTDDDIRIPLIDTPIGFKEVKNLPILQIPLAFDLDADFVRLSKLDELQRIYSLDTFITKQLEVFDLNNVIFSNSFWSDPSDIAAFLHGSIVMNLKSVYYIDCYADHDAENHKVLLNLEIGDPWRSTSYKPIIFDFYGHENVDKKSVIYSYQNTDHVLYSYINPGTNRPKVITKVVSVINSATFPELIIKVSEDISDAKTSNLDAFAKQVKDHLESIRSSKNAYDIADYQYLSRFLFGLFSIKKSENNFQYFIAKVGKNRQEGNDFTTFVLKTHKDNLDVVLNIHESTQTSLMSVEDFQNAANLIFPKKADADVTDRIVIDVKSGFVNGRAKFISAAREYKDYYEKNVFIRRVKVSDLSDQLETHPLEPIEKFDVQALLTVLSKRRLDKPAYNEAALNRVGDYIEQTFRYFPNDFELKHVLDGLFCVFPNTLIKPVNADHSTRMYSFVRENYGQPVLQRPVVVGNRQNSNHAKKFLLLSFEFPNDHFHGSSKILKPALSVALMKHYNENWAKDMLDIRLANVIFDCKTKSYFGSTLNKANKDQFTTLKSQMKQAEGCAVMRRKRSISVCLKYEAFKKNKNQNEIDEHQIALSMNSVENEVPSMFDTEQYQGYRDRAMAAQNEINTLENKAINNGFNGISILNAENQYLYQYDLQVDKTMQKINAEEKVPEVKIKLFVPEEPIRI